MGIIAVLMGVAQRLRDIHGDNNTNLTCTTFRDDRERDLSKPFVARETVPFALLFPLALTAAVADTVARAAAAARGRRCRTLAAGTLAAA